MSFFLCSFFFQLLFVVFHFCIVFVFCVHAVLVFLFGHNVFSIRFSVSVSFLWAHHVLLCIVFPCGYVKFCMF